MYRFNRLPRKTFPTRRRGFSSARSARPRRRTVVNRRVKRKEAKSLSAFQNIAKSVTEFVSALPFVPSPVKSIADFIGKQLGVASINEQRDSRGALNATPNYIVYLFEISIVALIAGSKQVVLNSPAGQFLSNFRTAQPLNWTVTVSPVGRTSTVEGFLHVAMFPYTSPSSAKEVRDIDKTGLGITDYVARAPIKKRVSAASSIVLSYQVPAGNAFLNRGFDLAKPSATNGICAIYIGFEQQNRDSYDDFKPSDFDVDIRLNGQAKMGDPNTTAPIAFDGSTCTDLLKGLPSRIFVHKTKDSKVLIDGSDFKYDDTDNMMYGDKKILKANIMTQQLLSESDDDYDMGTDVLNRLRV